MGGGKRGGKSWGGVWGLGCRVGVVSWFLFIFIIIVIIYYYYYFFGLMVDIKMLDLLGW